MCVLIFSTTFLCNIFIVRKVDRELIKNIRKSSCQRAVFLVRFTRNLNFPDRRLKNIQVPILMKFVQCDRRTNRHDEANSCFSQFDAPNKEPFLSIFSQTTKVSIRQVGNFVETCLLAVALNQVDRKQRNKIFRICFESCIMEKELNREKQVV